MGVQVLEAVLCMESCDSCVQREPIPNLDTLCLAGGAGAWYVGRLNFGLEGGLPLAKRALPVRAAGALLLAGSVGLRVCAIECFKQNQTPLAHRQEVKALVTDGPFAWSRNPMYLSMVGALSSVGLLLNSWWGIAATLPFAAYLQFRVVPDEERYLHAKFEGYTEYTRRTPRWLLF